MSCRGGGESSSSIWLIGCSQSLVGASGAFGVFETVGTLARRLSVPSVTGRAVSAAGAGKWADRLLPLPDVLRGLGDAPDSEIAQTEVFGPALSVLKFRHDDEAITIANGTSYGLVGGVFTTDLERAMGVARQLRSGQVFVNEWYAGGVETPFGGYGRSGYGREKGREALGNYVQTKNIAIRLRS